MTIDTPELGIINFGDYRTNFRVYEDIVSHVYVPGMTQTELVEAIRVWISRTLLPYLRTNFQGFEVSWETQVEALVSQVQTSIQEALTAIANADIPITDPVVLALLTTAGTQVRTWLDNQYVSQVHNAPNPYDGMYHVEDYGAKGDGATQDHAACQAAIDAASSAYTFSGVTQRVFFAAKTYAMGVANYYKTDGTQYGITSLNLKDGVELCGMGTLRTINGAYGAGALYSLVRSPDTGISNAGLRGLTLNSNKTNNTASIQAGAVTLEANTNVYILDVNVTEANGNGIMVRGSTTAIAKDIRIQRCHVSNCSSIGIQASQFDGLEITNNYISYTTDNGIDIYGENGTTTPSGTNFTINNNQLHHVGNGIFLETVAKGVCTGNRINSPTNEGFHVNRINGAPGAILIGDNHVFGGQNSVGLTGDTDGVTIRGNEFEYYNLAGVSMGGAGNVSNYYILDNTMNGVTTSVPMVVIKNGTNQAAKIVSMRNITKNRDRAYDFINYCTNNADITHGAALSPGDTVAAIEG